MDSAFFVSLAAKIRQESPRLAALRPTTLASCRPPTSERDYRCVLTRRSYRMCTSVALGPIQAQREQYEYTILVDVTPNSTVAVSTLPPTTNSILPAAASAHWTPPRSSRPRYCPARPHPDHVYKTHHHQIYIDHALDDAVRDVEG